MSEQQTLDVASEPLLLVTLAGWRNGSWDRDAASVHINPDCEIGSLPVIDRWWGTLADLDCVTCRIRAPQPDPAPTGRTARMSVKVCPKDREGRLDSSGKPAHWYMRTIDGVTEYACSRGCISEGLVMPW